MRLLSYAVAISSADSSMNTRPPEFANPTGDGVGVGKGGRASLPFPTRDVRVLPRSFEEPEPGVHVARVHQLRGRVVGDAPDLGRVRECVALRGLDRVLRRRWHKVGDLLRVARVL